MSSSIDQLIITSPYAEPTEHWTLDHASQTFSRQQGRRPAGYMRASANANPLNDPGRFVGIPLVNQTRPRVKAWREKGYPGVSGVTKHLLEHWHDPGLASSRRFFFCQLEAIETLIWLFESDPSERVGLEIIGDGSPFSRLCAKMATGTGKTTVMAMVIAWQFLNKISYPRDSRFSKTALVMVPGRTVRSRLAVLELDAPDNYYAAFDIVPASMRENFRQGSVIIRNWQAMMWESKEDLVKRRSVDKRGPLSDEAYTRQVLGDASTRGHFFVINDEAHHAWRVTPKAKGVSKEAVEEATRWMTALDRLHAARRIATVFDFSATPFAPTGGRAAEDSLFPWIVSDFGLNDAIEAGLVKTPRIVVKDSGKVKAKTYRSALYHIYDDETVRSDLNRPASETEPLPQLVQNAYALLSQDWADTQKLWAELQMPVPPVMISVVNRTETAARVKNFFDRKRVSATGLCTAENTIQIDSSILKDLQDDDMWADSPEGVHDDVPMTKKGLAAYVRAKVNSVGQIGKPGERVCNLVSVGMLTEGWDAKTVTHIMGLRAFASQLLCEQVVGRGLRRTSYDVNPITGLFEAEYVNIFGIPFTYLPVESVGPGNPTPPIPKIPIYPDPSKREFEIQWPRILRIDRTLKPELCIDASQLKPLHIVASDLIGSADLGPTLQGRVDTRSLKRIALERLGDGRLQTVVFRTAHEVYEQVQPKWHGDKANLMAQVIALTQKFLSSDLVVFDHPPSDTDEELNRDIALMLCMSKVVQHLFESIRCENTLRLEPVYDHSDPIGSTGAASSWYTSRPCEAMRKTHMNMVVFDSAWEKAAAQVLDSSALVSAWVKNDHLNFEVLYAYNGSVHRYRPDFIVKMTDGTHMILEVKGQAVARDDAKWNYTDEWIEAVNLDGRFGRWCRAVSSDQAGHDIAAFLKRASSSS